MTNPMPKQEKHTPTPWMIDPLGDTIVTKHSISGDIVCESPTKDCEDSYAYWKANSRHIVKCVNNHDRLVEALKYIVEECNPQYFRESSIDGVFEKAKAALQAIEDGQ